jgi:hypothetical protein
MTEEAFFPRAGASKCPQLRVVERDGVQLTQADLGRALCFPLPWADAAGVNSGCHDYFSTMGSTAASLYSLDGEFLLTWIFRGMAGSRSK